MHDYELTDFEWSVIRPVLPNKPRGVPRVDDRRTLNGIFWIMRTGAPWRAMPKKYGSYSTCYNRFMRWRRAGVWEKVLASITVAYRGKAQLIDSARERYQGLSASLRRPARIAVWVRPPPN